MVYSAHFVTGFALRAVLSPQTGLRATAEKLEMSVKLLTDSMEATITDDDQIRIDTILSFWFREHALSAPQIDRRMDIWFSEDPVFDHEIEKEFADDVASACEGRLDHWAAKPDGRLALIILIDQFRRNIYRNTAKAFSMDRLALELCVKGAMEKKDKGLSLRAEILEATVPEKLRPLEKDLKATHNIKKLKFGKKTRICL